MNFAFEQLVAVSFRHSYFRGELFNGLAVEPTADTRWTLQNHGLVFKTVNGGFILAFDRTHAGQQRDRSSLLNAGLQLSFTARLTDLNFFNYTVPFTGEVNKRMFHFTNASTRAELHGGTDVSDEDLFTLDHFGEHYFVKPFARIDLQLNKKFREDYVVRFKAKETYWRYILMSDHLNDLDSPAILDSSTSELFDGPEKLPVRGKETLAFRSKSPIRFSQDPKTVFQLVDNYDAASGRYKVVMRALPLADPNHITLVSRGATTQDLTNYSEIFIH